MSRGPTLAVTSAALFMVTLDNLVVTTALPSIRSDLGASLGTLEWVLNGYTLTFGVLMLLAAAVGERYGRRATFAGGLAVFTAASAACALAPTAEALVAARAVQGTGAAAVLPISLTLLAAKFDGGDRGLALGIWSGTSGLGVALGPLVGGVVVAAGSWQWVFWANVPVGLATLAGCLALGPSPTHRRPLDLVGAVLGTAGLAGVLGGLAAAAHRSWGSPFVLVPLGTGLVLLAAFALRERLAAQPMLPPALFRLPGVRAVNAVNVAMYFGMFGCIFLLAPFLQTARGLSPLQAGLWILPWTLMPLFLSPVAGVLCDRVGPRRLVSAGMALQGSALAWVAAVLSPDLSFSEMLGPCLLGGVGMAMVYPASTSALLRSVDDRMTGMASGAMNSLRELAGALGVAAVASLFAALGGSTLPAAYVHGLRPALLLGAAVVGWGVLAARRLPGPVKDRSREGTPAPIRPGHVDDRSPAPSPAPSG